MRILSDEEMNAIWHTEYAMYTELEWSIKDYFVSRNLMEAQDAKTYKAALKEVGEWLESELVHPPCGHSCIGIEEIQSLLKGELPHEI